ncbi:hypothetical protein AAFF_G00343610 [Aldrovandia affinis]|uniref:Uncharacterized protein n=1 Tax=Aldrovandia affinis TaxID=143900 RepID=A0AAD7SJX8_9TELE|nr:hypothetical protein AAFF_G00343610 [Aldrovandia affinis]
MRNPPLCILAGAYLCGQGKEEEENPASHLRRGDELPSSRSRRDSKTIVSGYILRYGIYLREQSEDDRRNYPVDLLVGDIYPGLICQWSKANAVFKPPVINEKVTIMSKLKEVWNQAVKFSLGKGKLDAKERFSVKAQETGEDVGKAGDGSKEENAATAEKAARKDVERFLADGDEDLELERSGAEDEFVPEVELFHETDPEPAASAKVQKNFEIPNIALASVRYGIGLRPTAVIPTAALIDAGIITEDNTSKVIRTRSREGHRRS